MAKEEFNNVEEAVNALIKSLSGDDKFTKVTVAYPIALGFIRDPVRKVGFLEHYKKNLLEKGGEVHPAIDYILGHCISKRKKEYTKPAIQREDPLSGILVERGDKYAKQQ